MSKNTLVTKPPNRLLKFFLKVPVLLYRLKLGWLLGGRFILINHVGRKSGKVRKTVVEVVAYDKVGDIYYVASGWGYKSNWYQNLLANPAINIQVGLRKMNVLAKTLPPVESAKLLLEYRTKHPFAARELSYFIGLDLAKASEEEMVQFVKKALPLVGFHPNVN